MSYTVEISRYGGSGSSGGTNTRTKEVVLVGSPSPAVVPVKFLCSLKFMLYWMLFRYEREHNAGIRPPFQKIANQDVPACHPMVLCVSDIFWSPGMTDDGMPIDAHPELEVTDGWYRLKAQIDLPMARAVRKGIIRIGRKFSIAGARVSDFYGLIGMF